MAAKATLTFKIHQGDAPPRTEVLSQDIIKIGKLPSSHLRIEDDNVSRMHAVIEVTSVDEVFIIDLGSASGTIVNGKKVNKCQLQSGDEIQLGDVRVMIEIAALAMEGEVAVPVAMPRPSAPKRPSGPLIANPFAESVPNPFAAAIAVAPVIEDPEQIQYGIVASAPPVQPDLVESADAAVEVMILWGDRSVLHVDHLSPPRSYYVGEFGADFLLGRDVLGTDRLPLVVPVQTASGRGIAAVIPDGASCTVMAGGESLALPELQTSGRLQSCAALAGAHQVPLPDGAAARVEFKGFTFIVRSVHAGRRLVGARQFEMRPFAFALVSLLVHAVFLTLFYFLPPRAASLSLDLLNADSRLVRFLMEPPELVVEETPEWLDSNKNDDEGGTGERHKLEEGQMGKQEAKKTKNRYGIQGPEDNPDPHMARQAALENAAQAGAIGVLKAMAGAFDSPTSPFGRDSALGQDPMSALGALMGDSIGENFGFGGLGLRGTGRGGGGTGEGTIGLGRLGTIGHGAGGGTGSGYGRGAGGFSGREAKIPTIRQGTADVMGQLSREVIRRVIRRHINEVRFCYEQELAQRPDLEGRVTVNFVIASSGAVQSSAVVAARSDIGSPRVESCISDAVRRWTFPAPEGGGIVAVTYPFMLTQGGGETE